MRFAGNKIFVVLASGAVELGIYVLQSNGYGLLKNKRVRLMRNQTAVDSRGVRTRELLRKNCNLVALYAPEHGLDGTFALREMFFKCCGSSLIASQFAGGIGPSGIVASWTEDVTRFKGERSHYLLY